MKYVKVETILPDSLVKEIQKYIQGKYIYIPLQMEKKKKWGENSGSRSYIQNRNEKIRNMYKSGHTILNLAQDFFLSIDSIKKIIYTKCK
ncbi:CD3324 family protein [Clostridium akagii]|uniref:CD3324 family protein n=1 Tax=Clostridium akagii TaxID=91623 RepID=UPI00047E2482|nr:CD3324 family protein [Clostridium akagii]